VIPRNKSGKVERVVKKAAPATSTQERIESR